MFDGISYGKGGSVLRMLRAFLDRDQPDTRLRRRLLQVRLLQLAALAVLLAALLHQIWPSGMLRAPLDRDQPDMRPRRQLLQVCPEFLVCA